MTGVELIAEERRRQIEEEGWTIDHDIQHTHGEIASAAACYAMTESDRNHLAQVTIREEKRDSKALSCYLALGRTVVETGGQEERFNQGWCSDCG